jgi:hypothetical protein
MNLQACVVEARANKKAPRVMEVRHEVLRDVVCHFGVK